MIIHYYCCINREVSVQVAARRGHQNLCVNRQGATPLLPFKLLIQILFGEISTIAPKSMMRIKSGFFIFIFCHICEEEPFSFTML